MAAVSYFVLVKFLDTRKRSIVRSAQIKEFKPCHPDDFLEEKVYSVNWQEGVGSFDGFYDAHIDCQAETLEELKSKALAKGIKKMPPTFKSIASTTVSVDSCKKTAAKMRRKPVKRASDTPSLASKKQRMEGTLKRLDAIKPFSDNTSKSPGNKVLDDQNGVQTTNGQEGNGDFTGNDKEENNKKEENYKKEENEEVNQKDDDNDDDIDDDDDNDNDDGKEKDSVKVAPMESDDDTLPVNNSYLIFGSDEDISDDFQETLKLKNLLKEKEEELKAVTEKFEAEIEKLKEACRISDELRRRYYKKYKVLESREKQTQLLADDLPVLKNKAKLLDQIQNLLIVESSGEEGKVNHPKVRQKLFLDATPAPAHRQKLFPDATPAPAHLSQRLCSLEESPISETNSEKRLDCTSSMISPFSVRSAPSAASSPITVSPGPGGNESDVDTSLSKRQPVASKRIGSRSGGACDMSPYILDIARNVYKDLKGEDPLPVDEKGRVIIAKSVRIQKDQWEKYIRTQVKDTLFTKKLGHALYGHEGLKIRTVALPGRKNKDSGSESNKQIATPEKVDAIVGCLRGKLMLLHSEGPSLNAMAEKARDYLSQKMQDEARPPKPAVNKAKL